MKKKSLGVLIALLLIVGAGAYTYARYTSSFTGTGEAQVAKWSVSLEQGGEAVSEDFDLELTLSDTDYVVDGRIAPGRTATAQLVLDLSNTEVAADYEIDLSGVNGLPTGMEIASVKATVEGGNATELSETDGKYSGFVALGDINKTITFDITLSWTNDEANNATDTAAGKTPATLSIPVTVTAKQHIA